MTPVPVREGIPLGPGREFDLIRRILGRSSASVGEGRVGPGDDAAVLEDATVLSTDLFLEDIHFRRGWITLEEAGYRAAAGGLSDLAAMAAVPVGLLASIAAPRGAEAEALMAGVLELAGGLGIPLLGGDVNRSPGPLVLDVVSVGRAEHPLLRRGARPGDDLWVTGVLGGAAGAVALWEAGRPVPAALRRAFARPRPRFGEARWLREAGARAGLDLSDGLAGDAGHLAAASGVALVLDGSALPIHPALEGMDRTAGSDPRELALRGGEDFELLVALPPGGLEGRVEEFRARFDLSLSPVGRVVEGEGVYLQGGAGNDLRRIGGGYDHLREEGGAG